MKYFFLLSNKKIIEPLNKKDKKDVIKSLIISIIVYLRFM